MSRVNNGQLAFVQLGGQRNFKAEPTHLLLQIERVRAHHRPENARTAAELRRPQAALTGATRTFLLVGLPGRASDFADPFRLVGAGAAFCQLPIDNTNEDVAPDLKPEDLVGEFDVADLRVVEIADDQLHREASDAGFSVGRPAPCTAAGNGSPSGALRLVASLTST